MMGSDQTELEYECAECAEYIIMRLEHNGEPLTEDNLAMWIHDHFKEKDDD